MATKYKKTYLMGFATRTVRNRLHKVLLQCPRSKKG